MFLLHSEDKSGRHRRCKPNLELVSMIGDPKPEGIGSYGLQIRSRAGTGGRASIGELRFNRSATAFPEEHSIVQHCPQINEGASRRFLGKWCEDGPQVIGGGIGLVMNARFEMAQMCLYERACFGLVTPADCCGDITVIVVLA